MRLQGKSEEIDAILCPIVVGSSTLGEIYVWETQSSAINQIDLKAIEHAATISALKLMELRSVNQIELRLRNDVLDGLLSTDRYLQEEAIHKLRQLDISLNNPYAVIIVGADINHQEVLSSQEKSILDESLYTAKKYVKTLNHDALFWYQGSRLVIYFPFVQENFSEHKDSLIAQFKSISDHIGLREKMLPLSIGISRTITEMTEFRHGYHYARQSLDIGLVRSKSKTGEVTHFEDLGIFRNYFPQLW